MHKTPVLILLYYWPPAGGPGVQRWLKFVKYLPEYGFHPIVAIPKNAAYPIIDQGLMAEIPNNITVLEIPIYEPLHGLRKLGFSSAKTLSQGIIKPKQKQSLTERLLWWIRANVFIPDARISWVKKATQYIDLYLEKNKVELLITTGPPHSLHLVGEKIKRKHDIRWIADFRDPWTSIGYHRKLPLTNRAAQKHKWLEKKILQNADHIVVTSQGTAAEFKELTSKPITVITNGYDLEVSKSQQTSSVFSLAHIGSLLSERNPLPLWKVLHELVQDEAFARDFSLDLVGVVSPEVLESLQAFELMPFVKRHGYVSHQQAVVLQKKAQILLLIEINAPETAAILPGKIFEYMVSGRPILALGPQNSDIKAIIEETETGVFFDYKQEKELKQLLLDWYQLFLKQQLVVNAKSVEKYNRKNLTQDLAFILKNETP